MAEYVLEHILREGICGRPPIEPRTGGQALTTTFSGGCLCGAVRYNCTATPMMAGHCHCEDCRRSSGTGHSSHLAVSADAVTMTGVTKAYVRSSDSGNPVTRAFCPECGAPVFSTNPALPGLLFLRASSLDDLEVFKPQMHVWTMRAPSWDAPFGGLPAFEKMPPGM
ncbi:GFA family protein [Bradyrhizobium aeschynomenes]|uniref:GFA family protein n=1 Tax=Bradyrhizobium aeschynomenes TaxID=2734909 RepID=UPI001FED6FB9|nr:GFA family protein [Bradyrhizobium aeschynomenes]